jgi:hypothetical protein
MRIRILQPRTARIDGIDLSMFHPGHVYEVESSVATYLIVSGVAEPTAQDAPALVVRSDEVMVPVCVGAVAPVAEVADDWDDDRPPEPAA